MLLDFVIKRQSKVNTDGFGTALDLLYVRRLHTDVHLGEFVGFVG